MRGRADFSVVAPSSQAPLRRRRARVVELATLALIVLPAIGLVDLTKAAMGVALALLALRVVTPGEARRSINLDIIAMIAFSLGLGARPRRAGWPSRPPTAWRTVDAGRHRAGCGHRRGHPDRHRAAVEQHGCRRDVPGGVATGRAGVEAGHWPSSS